MLSFSSVTHPFEMLPGLGYSAVMRSSVLNGLSVNSMKYL